MASGTQDADTDTEANDEDERSRLGRWWQHFLDVVEFVFDLF